MRANCLIFGLGTAASVASAWQCEPAFKSKFCSQAVAEGPEKCLQCAFNSYDAMKGYGCNKGTIQSVCNATLAQWTTVVAPYMATTNTDCSTHNRNCNGCLHDESFYTHEVRTACLAPSTLSVPLSALTRRPRPTPTN